MNREPGSFPGSLDEQVVAAAMQRLATQTLAPTPPPFATLRLRAEFARREQMRARRDPVQAFLPAAVAVVLVAGLFWWIGAPPQNLLRESIDLATGAARVFTGGLGIAIFFGFAMLTFVLMEEARQR